MNHRDLNHARWPDGLVCPAYGERTHSTFLVKGEPVGPCVRCRRQTTLRSGTLFHASKLPLTKWLLALYLIGQDKNNHSTLSLKHYLDISYCAAWRLKHKLLEAIARRLTRERRRGGFRTEQVQELRIDKQKRL